MKPARSGRPRSTAQFGITTSSSPLSPNSETASNPPGNGDLSVSEGNVRTQIAARFNAGSRVDLAQLILYIQQHHSFILFQLPPIPHPTDLSAFQNFAAIRVVFIQGDESARNWRVLETITVPDFESSTFPRSMSHRNRPLHSIAAPFLPPGGISVVLNAHVAALLHLFARKPAVGAMERGVPQRLLPPRRSSRLSFPVDDRPGNALRPRRPHSALPVQQSRESSREFGSVSELVVRRVPQRGRGDAPLSASLAPRARRARLCPHRISL